MTIPQSVIDKYNKVRMLAQRGEGNEAKNAKRILENMVRQHPGIKEAAAKTRHREKQADRQVYDQPEPQGRHWSDVYQEQTEAKVEREHRKERWKEWKDKAGSFFQWAAESAHQAFSMHQLQEWAYDVEIRLEGKQKRFGKCKP